MFFKSKAANMSLPKTITIHEIEIKKVPVGQYITAMREMEDLPRVLVEECFPGKSTADVIAMFTTMDQSVLISLIGKLLIVIPEHIVDAACSIIGLDKDIAMNKLTPKELLDVVKAYWELNDMSDFFGSVWGLIKRKLPTLNFGSSAGLPSQRASASANKAS